jgi:hypothetical protein
MSVQIDLARYTISIAVREGTHPPSVRRRPHAASRCTTALAENQVAHMLHLRRDRCHELCTPGARLSAPLLTHAGSPMLRCDNEIRPPRPSRASQSFDARPGVQVDGVRLERRT